MTHTKPSISISIEPKNKHFQTTFQLHLEQEVIDEILKYSI